MIFYSKPKAQRGFLPAVVLIVAPAAGYDAFETCRAVRAVRFSFTAFCFTALAFGEVIRRHPCGTLVAGGAAEG